MCTILFVEGVVLLAEDEEEPALSAGQTELPHCPVCLERLDQHISGVLTTVCNHSFHCTCLSQWADSSCPVCRYILAPPAASRCQVYTRLRCVTRVPCRRSPLAICWCGTMPCRGVFFFTVVLHLRFASGPHSPQRCCKTTWEDSSTTSTLLGIF